MKLELRYFTGTGNSLKVLETCKNVFLQNGHQAEMHQINTNGSSIPEADILGFCFPVYAFGIPRICRNYLKSVRCFESEQKVFVLITAGDPDESGFAINECSRILKTKNCEIIYSDVIQMPINWTTSASPPFPPSKEEAKEIIENGISHAKQCASEIENGIEKKHRFNYPGRYSVVKFLWEYWAFRYLGLPNMWRMFRTYETCTGCGVCEKICPTGSIVLTGGKPAWRATCEQCMRCVNFCPHEAIYQTFGGGTRGKNKYSEPDFIPENK